MYSGCNVTSNYDVTLTRKHSRAKGPFVIYVWICACVCALCWHYNKYIVCVFVCVRVRVYVCECVHSCISCVLVLCCICACVCILLSDISCCAVEFSRSAPVVSLHNATVSPPATAINSTLFLSKSVHLAAGPVPKSTSLISMLNDWPCPVSIGG